MQSVRLHMLSLLVLTRMYYTEMTDLQAEITWTTFKFILKNIPVY